MQARKKPGAGLASRARRLARRYGTGYAKAGLAVFLVACVAVFAAVYYGGAGGSGTTIQRSTGSEAAAEAVSVPGPEASGGDDAKDEAASSATAVVVVHVDGAVEAPGVYSVAEGSRVNDAVLAAGGLSEGADTSTMNLAAPLADGSKVHVPTSEELSAGSAGASGESSGIGSGGSFEASGGLVNLNTATSAELQTLSGVGEATASAIIEDRETNGPFTSAEDLMRVPGIGEKKFAKIRDHVCV